jgi:hypothetical protein
MTNKLPTRSPERSRLWKWLRALSCYTTKHTLLNYIVFFKGRAQCIQHWCQRHSKTTWTRWGLQTLVYPSSMWCWIRCRSTPGSHEAEWKDQPGATGWGNTSHITRLLLPASMYYLVQCRCEISLPLISITRLLPPTIRYTRLTTLTRRLLYFINYHIQDCKTSRSTPRLYRFIAAHQGDIIGQGATYMDLVKALCLVLVISDNA